MKQEQLHDNNDLGEKKSLQPPVIDSVNLFNNELARLGSKVIINERIPRPVVLRSSTGLHECAESLILTAESTEAASVVKKKKTKSNIRFVCSPLTTPIELTRHRVPKSTTNKVASRKRRHEGEELVQDFKMRRTGSISSDSDSDPDIGQLTS